MWCKQTLPSFGQPNTIMSLECVTVETGETPVGCVVWLHGLGADAHDFEPIIPMLKLETPLRFVFPNAPMRSVAINNGMEMRAWYDVDSNSPLASDADIRASVASVAEIIGNQDLVRAAANRIVLAGFSQGGVIALELGLSHRQRLGGIMALSTYIHDHERLAERIGLANVETPIFMAHGLLDPLIPVTRGATARAALRSLNYAVEWREYSMGHQVCPEEVIDIGNWLNAIFASGQGT